MYAPDVVRRTSIALIIATLLSTLALADPGDALIALLKPLMVLVALVVGFVGAALILESHASAESVQPAVPEPAPAVAALADEPTEELF